MATVNIWYMIDGDVCKYANQQYGADYAQWNNTYTASGKTVQLVKTAGKFTFPTNASSMFRNCANTTIDLSNIDTSQCTNMAGLFASCRSLTSLDLSGFNTSNVTDMSDMFEGASSLTTLDLSSFNTSNVVYFTDMFSGCTNLASVNVSSFNTSKAGYLQSMFLNCKSLTSLNLHNFNTSNCTFMQAMFQGCSNLKWLDLYNFNVTRPSSFSSTLRTDYMFAGCSNLERVFVKAGQDWNVFYVGSTGMFDGCTKILNWDGTTDKTRANNTTDYGYFGVYGIWMYEYDVYEKTSDSWIKGELYLKDNDTWKAQAVMLR